MSFKAVLLPRALAELEEAWGWYEDKQAGLGDKFKKEVYSVINHLVIYPEHFSIRKRPYREALVNIFPYLIIYRIFKKEKLIIISSVFNARRNPGKKYK